MIFNLPPPPPGSDLEQPLWRDWFFRLTQALNLLSRQLGQNTSQPIPAFLGEEGSEGEGAFGLTGAPGPRGPSGLPGIGIEGQDGEDGSQGPPGPAAIPGHILAFAAAHG